jgi:DNA-directed RNA polymerase
MLMKTKEERQIDLERDSHHLGIERYRKKLLEARSKKVGSSLKPERSIMLAAITKYVDYLQQERDKQQSKENKFRKPLAMKLIEDVDPEVVAYIVANEVVNGLSDGRRVMDVYSAIASAINDHKLLKEFSKKNQRLYAYAIKKVNESSNVKYKRNSLKHYAHYAGYRQERDRRKSLVLGAGLLTAFIQVTGIVEIHRVAGRTKCNQGRGHSSKRESLFLKATPEITSWLQEKHDELELLRPFFQPMIVPPCPWTTTMDGGYRTMTTPFVKGYSVDELHDLNTKHDLSTVYKAVNAVQNTAWKINKRVLDIFEIYLPTLDNEGIDSIIIPSTNEKELPQLPCDIDSIDEYKALHKNEWATWKQEKSKVISYNKRNAGKYITAKLKLELARKFKDEEELYFPHNVDFRGRVYPLVPLLNPQSDDLGKALLKFTYGEELGEHGEYWLKVHLANSYGIDKESFDDRVAWTDKHKTYIQMVALDPLLCRSFWEKAGSPWQFLAACYEYNDYLESGLGSKFISNLPIGLDGSCNGIQHFSAILKDKEGGSFVNLVPQDKPADVYQQVADKVEIKLKASDDPLASTWIGKVTRKLVKRQVMTLPYAATFRGMEDMLHKFLKEQLDDGIEIIKVNSDKEQDVLVHFITKLILEAIKETLVSSVTMMDWLKEVAKIISDTGQPIQWTTPSGFRARQSYKRVEWKEINTQYMHIRIRGRYLEVGNELDKRKQSSSISPNVVHSFDAAHMVATVNRMVNKGVQDFSMVHDSFAVHAGHVEELAKELRDTFIEQYSGNFMEMFKKQLETTHKVELPPVPAEGTLDLNLVKHSDYFFN